MDRNIKSIIMEYKKSENTKYVLTKEQKEYIYNFFTKHKSVLNDWESKFIYSLCKWGTVTTPQKDKLKAIMTDAPTRKVMDDLFE